MGIIPRKLVIDAEGAYIDAQSFRTGCEPVHKLFNLIRFPDRLEIRVVKREVNGGVDYEYPCAECPTIELRYVDVPIPTLEEAANDIPRRENGDLRREIEGLHESINEYVDQLRKSEKERQGLMADVKQAEAHYEAASERCDELREALKVAQNARTRYWELYTQTIERFRELAKDLKDISDKR